MIIDNNFGSLCMKKGGSFKKRGFHFFQSSMGGFDPPTPPHVRTPLTVALTVLFLYVFQVLQVISVQLQQFAQTKPSDSLMKILFIYYFNFEFTFTCFKKIFKTLSTKCKLMRFINHSVKLRFSSPETPEKYFQSELSRTGHFLNFQRN